MPELQTRWLLEGDVLPGSRPAAVLDILDPQTGFIIASDLIQGDYLEKDRASVVQKALQVTGSTPEMLVLGPGVSREFLDLEANPDLPAVFLDTQQATVLLRYTGLKSSRSQIVSRRLNFDSVANNRLICAAWRIHYNFQGTFSPAGWSPYNTWLDIIKTGPAP